MTIGSVVHSVLSVSGLRGTAHLVDDPRDPGGVAESPEWAALRRCEDYRRSLSAAELVLPADALRNGLIAKWVRDKGTSVEVRTGEELAVALAASIRPRQLIVFTHSLSESELRATVNLHPGRVVVGAAEHIAVLDTVGHGPQGVVVQVGGGVTAGFRSDTTAFDGATIAP